VKNVKLWVWNKKDVKAALVIARPFAFFTVPVPLPRPDKREVGSASLPRPIG